MSIADKKPTKKPQGSLFDPIDSSSSSDEDFEITANPLANKRCFISPDENQKFLIKNEIVRRLAENQGETILDIGIQGIFTLHVYNL